MNLLLLDQTIQKQISFEMVKINYKTDQFLLCTIKLEEEGENENENENKYKIILSNTKNYKLLQ